jgi:copper ion binding protein
MTCDGCAARVKGAISALPGVGLVVVDLPSQRVRVEYDPKQADLFEFQQAILAAGYTIPTRHDRLVISGMSCLSCVARVESALSDVPGVITVEVSLSKGSALVTSAAGMIDASQLARSVERAGYRAAPVDETDLPQAGGEAPSNEAPARFEWKFKPLLRRG